MTTHSSGQYRHVAKYLGDGVMAFFSYPEGPRQRCGACRSRETRDFWTPSFATQDCDH
jgi:hypothetical protein